MSKPNTENLKNDLYVLYQLSRRNIKIFLKDKGGVFFSLLAPIIVLLLYILFLGDVQLESVMSIIPESVNVSEKAVKAFIDSWMIAGVLGIACITVSLSANSIMVQDKTRKILNDGLTAPVKKSIITAGYFTYNFFVTVFIVTVVYFICLIYLAASGRWYLSATDVFGIFGVILLSALSATMITVFICGFLKTEAQHGGFVGIFSAVLGFLIGAYMPMSIMPKFAQYLSGIIPGSYSVGLFKHFLMTGVLEELGKTLPQEGVEELAKAFTMNINFFGKDVGADVMWVFLAVSIIIFTALNVVCLFRKKIK